jgi:hypothetical protein
MKEQISQKKPTPVSLGACMAIIHSFILFCSQDLHLALPPQDIVCKIKYLRGQCLKNTTNTQSLIIVLNYRIYINYIGERNTIKRIIDKTIVKD